MRTFCFFIALLLGQCSYGQWFNNISTFTTQNGLSNNTITCLQKDEAGFLWIGSHEGLNRYDGTEFINVLSNAKNNLPSNNITRISFINRSLLAVGTDAGLCLLNTETFIAKKIELPFITKYPNSGYFIEDILYRKDAKELWIATWHGIFILNEDGVLKNKLLVPEKEILNSSFAKFLFLDEHKDVYFFSALRKRFYYPDFKTGELIPIENKQPGSVLNKLMNEEFILRSGQMSYNEAICVFSKMTAKGNTDCLYYNNITTGKKLLDTVSIDFTQEKRLSSAYPLNDSTLLVNSYFGEPMLFNTNRHEITAAADHPLWFSSWPDGLGACVFRDKENIWIGTSKALLQSSLKTNYFKSNTAFINKINERAALVAYNAAVYDSNKLWVACMGAGLFSLDTTNNNIQSVFDKNTNGNLTKKLVSTEVIPVGRSLWLYSVYGPIAVDPNSKRLDLINGLNKDSTFDDMASYPLKDSKGDVWSSLPGKIARYNITSNNFTHYTTKYQGGNFPLFRVGAKAEDGKGNIWMARQDSLVKFDAATQSFSYSLISKNGKALRPVTLMASDGDDLLYMNIAGSFGVYHISTKAIDIFTKQTGIISTAINGLVSDKQGNAWIASEGGLVFYNKQKMKFSSFTKADGLPDDNVIAVNFTDDSKQTLFLGFSKTYCLFEPQNFLQEKSVPINIITGVEVNGEFIDPAINRSFFYKQNSISFTYTGINFNQGQQNSYACMLEGFDQAWKYPGSERKVNYINLPPGDYTFKVKTANHQGEWNDAPAIFSFKIAPPFWQRWWFKGLIICLVVSSIYFFIKRREASIQKEHNVKLQMSELRMQALRAQMNPHFIFNSLNSIQNYILSNNTIDAAGYLSKFAKLMRRILDQSKHNFLPLSEVMETLRMYVEIEAFRFNNEFIYTFNIEEDDELLDTKIPPMILQPFVENAILHGLMPKKGDKKLLISCSLVNKQVQIIIDDNGIGRTRHEPKAGHESQGEKLTAGMLESLQQLQNIKAFIEIIDKKENDIPAGTTVKLILALK